MQQNSIRQELEPSPTHELTKAGTTYKISVRQRQPDFHRGWGRALEILLLSGQLFAVSDSWKRKSPLSSPFIRDAVSEMPLSIHCIIPQPYT